MKKLFIGLGNPGKEYDGTRHNAGFMFIDYVLSRENISPASAKSFKDSIVYTLAADVVFAKPQTFMNNSGPAVKDLVKWHNIQIEKDFVLIHDDLDIKLGSYKFQFAKSPKEHNGVISVEQHLGTTHFHRLRIGVDNRSDHRINGERYVLQRFSGEEVDRLRGVFDEMYESESLV